TPFLVAPGLAEVMAPLAPGFLAGLSSGASSSSSGASTTKRNLHLGQSTFFPMSAESLTGTIASQLGHCCLKLIFIAMNGGSAAPLEFMKRGRDLTAPDRIPAIIAECPPGKQRTKHTGAHFRWRFHEGNPPPRPARTDKRTALSAATPVPRRTGRREVSA